MDAEIARLIGLLDDDSTEVAEDAKAALISIGSEVVGGTFWQDHESLDHDVDRHAPWLKLVEAARERALLEAAFVPQQPHLFVSLEWIGESDR